MATTMTIEELQVWYDLECKRIQDRRSRGELSAHEAGMGYAHIDDEYNETYDKIMSQVFQTA